MPAFKKKEMRPNTFARSASLTAPLARRWSSSEIAFAIEKAISCTGVAPASCRWYEQMLIGFQLGTCSTVYETISLVRRIEASGGKTKVPRERYSLMMSFWVVPRSLRALPPCCSAVAM